VFVPRTERHWSLRCKEEAVSCTRWMCSWMCFSGKQSSQEAALAPRDTGWKQSFYSCFLDLTIVTFLTLLCTLRVYPLRSILDGSPQCPPGRRCFATCTSSELPSLFTPGSHCCSLHHCFGMPVPLSSAIRAARGALWALSNLICSVLSCLFGLWGGETELLEPR